MKHFLCALVVAGLVAPSTHAQFVWISQDGKNSARVVFGDKADANDNAPAAKIAQVKLFVRNVEEEMPLPLAAKMGHYNTVVYSGMVCTIGGTCVHDVVTPLAGKPYLRVSHPKAVFGPETAGVRHEALRPWSKLPLDIVALSWLNDKIEFQLLWQGKPAAGCDFVAALSDRERSQGKTNSKGRFHISQPQSGESIEIRASLVEKKTGVHAGKAYKSVRHDATLTLPAHAADFFAPTRWPSPTEPLEHRAATELVKKAIAACATWHKFPGFSAALTVNSNGKIFKTKVEVQKDGKCKVEFPDAGAGALDFFAVDSTPAVGELMAAIVKLQLGAMVKDGPCGFVDNNLDHPLGRLIVAVNEKFQTSYRVKDNQILEVNRMMKESGVRLTGLKYQLNANNKYLPVSYLLSTWSNLEKVVSSASFAHTWKRIGAFDLPKSVNIIKSTYRKHEAPNFGAAMQQFPWAPPVQMPATMVPQVDTLTLTFADHRLLTGK